MDLEFNKDAVGYFTELPQHLCKMCGKCCRAITTPYSYDELLELAEEGQEEAKVFIEIFERYLSVDAARQVEPEHVENILNQLRQSNPNFDESKVTFFHCPHLTVDNLCSIHKTRPDCCRRAPRNGWSLFPPGCGFKGWQFQKKERVKHSVRKLKEYRMDLELLSPDTQIEGRNKTAQEMIYEIDEKISQWNRYGSQFW